MTVDDGGFPALDREWYVSAPEGIYAAPESVSTMSTDEPSVPIVCTECETETRVALSDVADALARHNDGKHDGEAVAEVEPALVAEDLGLFDEEEPTG